MAEARRMSAAVLCAALVLGGFAAPAVADQAERSNDPSLSRMAQTAAEDLEAAAAKARFEYRKALTEARDVRDEALTVLRAERDQALAAADTKAERRSARRAYSRAAAPVRATYAAQKAAARSTRNAGIEVALATYLLETGPAGLADDLRTYRDATEIARATQVLALNASAAVLATDTAEERTQLLFDLDQAQGVGDRRAAWREFIADTATQRRAYAASVSAGRWTYVSAMRQARSVFTAETGLSIRTLLKQAFGN